MSIHYPVFIIMTEIEIQKMENSKIEKGDNAIDHNFWVPKVRSRIVQ